MKAFVLSAPGMDGLTVTDIPSPGPLGAGQVRIAMHAASLNYRDLLMIGGASPAAIEAGFYPISDGAGEIVEVAPDVRRVKPGDRVALVVTPDWIGGPWRPGAAGRGSAANPGVMREEVVVHNSEVVVLPDHLSFEEGAALPCAGVTAWNALCGAAPLLPGMSVLLQGAGGVSLFALQFAKLFGARVIMTTSSAPRAAGLKSLGADAVIDYKADPEWHLAVRKLTGGVGVDLALDVGGAETVDKALASTRMGGRVAIVGLLTGAPTISTSMLSASVDINPIRVGSRLDFEAMNTAIGFHQTKPVIDSSYAFEQLPEALRHLKSGSHMGKITVRID